MGNCGSDRSNRNNSQPVYIKTNVAIKPKSAPHKVLDICQDKDAFGTLIIYEDYNQPNQRFDILSGGQYVYLVSKKTGKYLTVGSNSDKNGSPIFQQPTSSVPGQKFRLAPLGNNQYFIHTFCGKVFDCYQQSTSNGTRVIQYDLNRGDNQKWIIQ